MRYAEKISPEALSALRKLTKTSELGWLFLIVEKEDGSVAIVDIDYENGREIAYSEALPQMKKYLSDPLQAYGLTKAESEAFQSLVEEYTL